MEDWTEITSFTYPHEAHFAKSLLEASDIEVVIKDELTVQVNNLLSNAIGGVKILVRNNKAEEALLLLEKGGYINKEKTEDKPLMEVFSSEYRHTCPYCKSDSVVKKNLPGYVFALSIILLGFPLPFLKRTYYCYDCSREWLVK